MGELRRFVLAFLPANMIWRGRMIKEYQNPASQSPIFHANPHYYPAIAIAPLIGWSRKIELDFQVRIDLRGWILV